MEWDITLQFLVYYWSIPDYFRWDWEWTRNKLGMDQALYKGFI